MVLLLIAVAATWIRLHHLGKQPFWNDEGFSWWAVQHSWVELWTLLPAHDTHPQLYHTLLKLWSLAFGLSEAGLRSLALVFGVATVPVLFQLGRTLGGERDGFWLGVGASLLFALSALHLHYAHEARPYAALTFAATLALAGAVWLMRHPKAVSRPLLGWGGGSVGMDPAADAPSPRAAWLALMLGCELALWLHNLGMMLPITLGLGLLVWLGRDLRWSLAAFANLALAGILVILLWLPWLPWLIAQTADVGSDWYLSFPTGEDVLKTLSALFGIGYHIDPPLFAAGVLVALFGLAAIGRRFGLSLALLLLLGMVVPVGLSLLVSWLFQPIFLERTLVWASIPFYVALAGALLWLPAAWPRLLLVALAVYLSIQGTNRYDAKHKKEPWDRIARTIAAEAAPGAVVLVMPTYTLPMMQLYAARAQLAAPLIPLPMPEAPFDAKAVIPAALMDAEKLGPDDLARLAGRLQDVPEVWLVYRRTSDISADDDRVLEALRASRPELRHDLIYSQILWLYRFGPQPGGGG